MAVLPLTTLIVYLYIGNATIYLAEDGLSIDRLKIPWKNIQAARLTGGGQAGIQLQIRYQINNQQRKCMQHLDLVHNPLELTDAIRRYGDIPVDVDPYIDPDRR